MSKNTIKWFLIIYISLLIFMTVAPINNTSIDFSLIYITDIRFDHLLHIIIFLPFCFLVRILKGVNYYASLKQVLLWLLFGLCFAAAAELIQLFIPDKSFTINDLVSNCIGVLSGAFVFFVKPWFNPDSKKQ